MKFLDKLKNQDSLLIFLVMECLALCSFALGGINYIFYGLGIFVGIITIAFSYNRFRGENLKTLLIFMVPMFLLSLLISFGKLFSTSILENILVFLSINIFLFLGIASRKFKDFKPDLVLMAIGVSIALLVFISMFATWIEYGFFYVERFKDTPIYYYNAETFDVTKETLFLVGFKFKEMSIDYTSTFAVILCCYLFAPLFISFKEDKRRFFVYLAIGLVGLIYLLTLPNFKALFFLIPALAVAVIYRFVKLNDTANDIINYALLALAVVFVVFFIFAFFNAVGSIDEMNPSKLASVIQSHYFTDRIFNSNRIMHPINIVLRQAAYKYNFFGFVSQFDNSVLSYLAFEDLEDAIFTNSKMFEIELVKEGGILTILLIVGIIVLSYINIRKYMKVSSDAKHEKIVIVTMLLSFVYYCSFENSAFPLIHDQDNYYSLFRNPLTLVMLFLLGFTYVSNIKEAHQKAEEKVASEGEVNI